MRNDHIENSISNFLLEVETFVMTRFIIVDDTKIYSSEIRCLKCFIQDSSVNCKQLAKKLSVTSSAASQTIKSLENKGVLNKYRDSNRKNELNISLTEFGTQVCQEILNEDTLLVSDNLKFFVRLQNIEQIKISDFFVNFTESLKNQ